MIMLICKNRFYLSINAYLSDKTYETVKNVSKNWNNIKVMENSVGCFLQNQDWFDHWYNIIVCIPFFHRGSKFSCKEKDKKNSTEDQQEKG